jgi:CheY-like chemotaxis protein
MRKKIVIVDDENDIREILRNSIELTKDWIVYESADGLEALEVIRREMPDAIVLDVMMPSIDGREVFRSLREDPVTTKIPVVFLTASLQRHEVRALEALGPVAVLAKPFDPLTIASEISSLLGW